MNMVQDSLTVRISVIIPFHMENKFKGRMSEGHSPVGVSYLTDCLDSLLQQETDAFEVILVEDGVSEDITQVKNRYRNQLGLRCISTGEDCRGVAAARNCGIAAARGEYLYFLDGDDYLEDGVLRRLLDCADFNPGTEIVYGSKEKTWFKRLSYLEERKKREREPEPEEFQDPVKWLLKPRTSVLNILFSKHWIDSAGIRFGEELVLYPDLAFMASALASAGRIACVYDAVYVKRIHNDEVQYPSLDQEKREDRTMQFTAAYRKAKEAAETAMRGERQEKARNGSISAALDRELFSYVLKAYTGRLHDRGRAVFTPEEFRRVKEAAALAGEVRFGDYPRGKRAVLKAVSEGNDKLAIRAGNRIVALKKRRELFKDSKLFFRVIDRYLFQRLPIRDHMVLFESFFGNSYSDSPKYIYEYMRQKFGDNYQYIWVLNKKTEVPGNPVCVRQFSLKYFYYLARSKYWVINIRLPKWIEKKKGHVFLQTWHGTPLKKLVFDMEDVHLASSRSSYKMNFYQETRNWDYLISDNPFSTEKFGSAFLYERDKILEIGYPRNDILKAEDRVDRAAAIKKKLSLPEDKKLILYAPTWRDDEYYEAGKYKFDLKLNLAQLKEAVGGEYAILLRTHYLIAGNLNLDGAEGFAYNVSTYDDISELYLISDLCITDYSSVFFDYANLRRPILFYVYDLDKYRDVLRGFYIDIETEVPGPLLYTTDEVIRAIRNIEEVNEEYRSRYDRFYGRFCSLDDGHASERAVDALLKR